MNQHHRNVHIRVLKAALIVLLIIALSPCLLFATGGVGHPNVARGINPHASSGTGSIDTVNLFNGGLGVTVPIGQAFTVSGTLSYQINLQYSSSVWDVSREFHCDPSNPPPTDEDPPEYIARPSSLFKAGFGWHTSFGMILSKDSPLNHTDQWAYIDSSGGNHYFYETLHEGESGIDDGVFFTRDGTYLKGDSVLVGDDWYARVRFPNGVVHEFERRWYDPVGEWRLVSMRDPICEQDPLCETSGTGWVNITRTLVNDLTGTICTPSHTTPCEYERWQIHDGAGREHHLFFWTPEKINAVPQETLSDRSGSVDRRWYLRMVRLNAAEQLKRACYRLDYDRQVQVDAPSLDCRRGYPPNTAIEEVDLLTKIIIPDGANNPCDDSVICNNCSAYEFEYLDTAPPHDDDGRLEEVTLPTGGSHHYAYHEYEYPDGNSGIEPWEEGQIVLQSSLGIETRKLVDLDDAEALWTYTPEPIDDDDFDQKSVYRIVTDPLGNDTKQFFNTDALPRTATGQFLRGWEYGLPVKTVGLNHLSRQEFTGVATGDGIRAHYLDYERDELPDIPSGSGTYSDISRHFLNSNRRVAGRETRYIDDVLTWAGPAWAYKRVNHSQFDGLGNYRLAEFESNFGDAHDNVWTDQNQRNVFVGYNRAETAESADYPVYCFDLTTNLPCNDHDYIQWPSTSEWIIGLYDKKDIVLDTVDERTLFDFDPGTGFLKAVRSLASDGETASGEQNLSEDDVLLTRSRTVVTDGYRIDQKFYGADSQQLSTSNAFPAAPGTPVFLTKSTVLHSALKKSGYYNPTMGGLLVGGLLVDRDIDPDTGWVELDRDVSGYPTDPEYDLLGRANEVTSGVDEAKATIEYIPAYTGNGYDGHAAIRTKSYGPDYSEGLTELLADSIVVLDGFGRPWRRCTETAVNGTWNYQVTEYDPLGRVERASVVDELPGTCSGSAAPSKATTFLYDRFSRPTLITAPDNTTTEFAYKGAREVTRTDHICTSASGGCASPTFDSVQTTERYDSFGRLRKVVEPGAEAPGAETLISTFEYDVGGRMSRASLTDGTVTQNRDLTYDNTGMLVEERIPERLNQPIQLEHDPLGNVIKSVTGDGEFAFIYDDASRPKFTRWTPTGGVETTLQGWTYYGGLAGQWNKHQLHTTEQRTFASPAGDLERVVTQEYEYAGTFGNVDYQKTSVSVTNSGVPMVPDRYFELNYTWNALGDLATLSYPVTDITADPAPPDRTIQYTYSNGWPKTVVDSSPVATLANIHYNDNGTVRTVVHGNGVRDRSPQDVNKMNRPQSLFSVNAVTSTGEDADWNSGLITYDGTGNIYQMGSDTFRYDPVSRLEQANQTDPGGLQISRDYGYDSFGNLTQKAAGGLEAIYTIPIDSASNRVQGAVYDWSGNMIKTTPTIMHSNTWDPLGRVAGFSPVSARDESYGYDTSGVRIVTHDYAVSGPPFQEATYTLRDLFGRPIREYVFNLGYGTFSWSRDHIFLGRDAIASEASTTWPNGGQILHHHRDHLGSLRLLTDPSKVVVNEQAFTPFGTAWASSMDEDLQFTGHEREPGHGWDYMHARYYLPDWGRFWSVDPIGGTPGVPQSWNSYSYVLNNPLNYIDPFGLEIGDFDLYWSRPSYALFPFGVVGGGAFGGGGASSHDPNPWPGARGTDPSRLGIDFEFTAFDDWVAGLDPSFDNWIQRAANFAAGFGDTLTFGWTAGQRAAGSVNTDSGWYTAGEVGGYAWGAAAGGAGALRVGGYRVTASIYSNARGAGVNLMKGTKRIFGLDWHRFKLFGKMVNRPHYHRAFRGWGGSIKRHRPWQGPW